MRLISQSGKTLFIFVFDHSELVRYLRSFQLKDIITQGITVVPLNQD
jgi:hypothetical protein